MAEINSLSIKLGIDIESCKKVLTVNEIWQAIGRLRWDRDKAGNNDRGERMIYIITNTDLGLKQQSFYSILSELEYGIPFYSKATAERGIRIIDLLKEKPLSGREIRRIVTGNPKAVNRALEDMCNAGVIIDGERYCLA